MGANFAVAYGREVANQALEVTDGDEEAVYDALDQGYTQLEEDMDSEIYINGSSSSGSSPNKQVSGVEEVFEDFQEEVGEMLG